MQAAIDFGISNTDAVARVDGGLRHWTLPSTGGPPTVAFVRQVLAAGGLAPEELSHLAVTGGRHQNLPPRIAECVLLHVGEVEAIGRGGQALAGYGPEDDAPVLVVSAGSGTAIVEARGTSYTHISGTGVGGGTLLGLARLLLHTTDPHEINALAQTGDPNRADLALRDVVGGPIGHLPPEATAVNFGRLGRRPVPGLSRADLAASLVTLVGQVIGLIAVNAARARAIEHLVVIGHLVDMPVIRRVLNQVGDIYNLDFTIPPQSGRATALGALLALP